MALHPFRPTRVLLLGVIGSSVIGTLAAGPALGTEPVTRPQPAHVEVVERPVWSPSEVGLARIRARCGRESNENSHFFAQGHLVCRRATIES